MDFINKIKKFSLDNKFFKPGEIVIAGVSGGIDSMAMLYAFAEIAKEFKFKIVVAHINYGLRGRDSDLDEDLVSDIVKQFGFEFFIHREHPENDKNLQESARNIRFSFFGEVAKKIGASSIALAHHIGDQVETVLSHLLRGSGLTGLSGMIPVSNYFGMRVVRPLLCVSRNEISEYVSNNRISYRDDVTNAGRSYLRNRIRHDLVPILEGLNPKASEHIAEMSKRLTDDDDALSEYAKSALSEILISSKNDAVSITRHGFIKFVPAIRSRILRLMFASVNGTSKDLNSDQIIKMNFIAESNKKSSSYRLPFSCKFLVDGDEMSIERVLTPCDR